MTSRRTIPRPGTVTLTRVAGGGLSLVVAVALFTRFGINGALSRDEGIYAYGGQQLAHGVAPYASIFDPKGPLATMIAGIAALGARVVGRNDIYVIRLIFFGCACLTVLALYLLTARLFRSTLAGIVGAVVFAASWPFAVDALAGPDAKTPALLFALVSMWLMTRRQWFLAALAGSLATLAWQPFLCYPGIAVLLALATTRTRRWRVFGLALLGAVVPVLLLTLYFAAVGQLGKFVESALVFPLTGIRHGTETTGHRILRIGEVVHRYYGFGGVLFWVGLGLLLLLVLGHLVRGSDTPLKALGAPLVSVVSSSLLFEAAYAATDFQSYPDLYAFLAFPAIGFAGAASVLVSVISGPAPRRVAMGGILVSLVLFAVATWFSFELGPGSNNRGFRVQLTSACAVERIQVPGTPIWSLGDPSVLAAMHRRNPDRFIYLNSAVDRWKVDHTVDGFDGWTRQIREAGPSVVVIRSWDGPIRHRMGAWLHAEGYQTRWAGKWRLFVTPSARTRATAYGVRLTRHPTKFATGPGGRRLLGPGCR